MDRSSPEFERNRPPCTAVTDPFRELYRAKPENAPSLYDALFAYNSEWYGELPEDADDWTKYEYYDNEEAPPEARGYTGFKEFPQQELGPGQQRKSPVYTMHCDECGRLYYGMKRRFGCPYCGFDRRSSGMKMRFTLWGAWGGPR